MIVIVLLAITACKKSKTPDPGNNTENNADVYIAGTSTPVNPNYYQATLWKNGAAVVLSPNSFGMAHGIAVQGGDVYVSGYIRTNNVSIATYWKNGVEIKLGDGTNNSYAQGVAVQGNDVYVAGYIEINNVDEAALWKNGTLTMLSNTYSFVSSIFVQGNDVYVAGQTASYNGPTYATY